MLDVVKELCSNAKMPEVFRASESYIDKSHAHLDQVVLALESNVTDIVSFAFKDVVDDIIHS